MMTCRTKRFKGHYGFKTENEFLAFCRQQAAEGQSVGAVELKMLRATVAELVQVYETLETLFNPTAKETQK